MAWESGLAYNAALNDAVREALEGWTVADLAMAIANDKYERLFPRCFNIGNAQLDRRHKAFDRWVREASALQHDVLVEDCLERAARTDTSDNGGWAVWIDKGGCSRVKPA